MTVRCFISMPFSPEFDQVYLNGISCISKILDDFKVEIIRLDKLVYQERGIEKNVLMNINNSHILIADISKYHYQDSHQTNVSVMHEIGYACGRNIPCILVGKKGSYQELPANLKGSIIIEYESENEQDLERFSHKLAEQVKKIIENEVFRKVKGQFQVEGFFTRFDIDMELLIENAKNHIYILTTNLNYIHTNLKASLEKVLKLNENNPQFKIDILTMEPESILTNVRATQLGKPLRTYRDELRAYYDYTKEDFKDNPKVEISTYDSLPMPITFIIDETVITSTVSIGQLTRDRIHFAFNKMGDVTEQFLSDFRTLKAKRY